jgi:peptide-methionine (R)-S-oxide reductase
MDHEESKAKPPRTGGIQRGMTMHDQRKQNGRGVFGVHGKALAAKTVAMGTAAGLLTLFACCSKPPAAASKVPDPTSGATPVNALVSAPAAMGSVTPSEPAAAAILEKDPMTISDEEWKKKLTPTQYHVLREKGTERAFTGRYWNTKDPGVYKCAGCGEVLFTSDSKFDSGCGWPSFFQPADGKLAGGEGAKVKEHVDRSFGMVRTEVTCAKCGGHLGHVFEDAPGQPTGLRYCINSASIEHEGEKDAPQSR